MKQGIIYAIYNKETETYYIGQTIHELNKRWKEHIYQSIKMNPAPLYKSMRKYGLDKFNIKVLEECPIDNLDEKETYWINEHNSYSKGYNQTTGAGGQYKISEDVKDRISETMSGVEKTPEHIANSKKNRKPPFKSVIVNGVYFQSVSAAASHFNVHHSTISYISVLCRCATAAQQQQEHSMGKGGCLCERYAFIFYFLGTKVESSTRKQRKTTVSGYQL